MINNKSIGKKHTMPFRPHYKPIYAQEYNAMYIYSLDF